eukprot:365252-Chlamydomonas_euryale.AAC.28
MAKNAQYLLALCQRVCAVTTAHAFDTFGWYADSVSSFKNQVNSTVDQNPGVKRTQPPRGPRLNARQQQLRRDVSSLGEANDMH